jgi:Tfp pilus assembly protein PilV
MAMITRQRHEMAVRRPEAGFSLISVLVAIVLLSVGMLAISQVLTQSVSMQTIMSMRTTALDVARSYMEEVKSRDPIMLVSETAVTVNDKGAVDANGSFTRGLTVKNVALHLNEITVTVTTRRSSPITLVTWIYDGEY